MKLEVAMRAFVARGSSTSEVSNNWLTAGIT